MRHQILGLYRFKLTPSEFFEFLALATGACDESLTWNQICKVLDLGLIPWALSPLKESETCVVLIKDLDFPGELLLRELCLTAEESHLSYLQLAHKRDLGGNRVQDVQFFRLPSSDLHKFIGCYRIW